MRVSSNCKGPSDCKGLKYHICQDCYHNYLNRASACVFCVSTIQDAQCTLPHITLHTIQHTISKISPLSDDLIDTWLIQAVWFQKTPKDFHTQILDTQPYDPVTARPKKKVANVNFTITVGAPCALSRHLRNHVWVNFQSNE